MEAIGCFVDRPSRALPELVKNFRGQIDWYRLGDTVAKCANEVQNKGYKVSTMQHLQKLNL